jgi:hypothetical protein
MAGSGLASAPLAACLRRYADNSTASETIPITRPPPDGIVASEPSQYLSTFSYGTEYLIAARPIHLLREARGAGPRHAGSELGPFRVTCYLEPGRDEDVRLT